MNGLKSHTLNLLSSGLSIFLTKKNNLISYMISNSKSGFKCTTPVPKQLGHNVKQKKRGVIIC